MPFSNELYNRLAQTLGSQDAARELLATVEALLNAIATPPNGEVVIPLNLAVTGSVLAETSVGAVAAAGSTNANAAALGYAHNVVSGADGTKGVVLPDTPVVGQKVSVINTDLGNALNVYSDPGGTGGTVNGGAANAAASLPAGKAALYLCISITGANQWWSLSN